MDYTFVKGQFTEAQLEDAIIALFEQQEYTYVHGESIHRKYEDILLLDDLRAFMQARYAKDDLTETELQKIINRLQLIPASPLYSGNRETFWLVNEGFDLMRDDLSQVALHIDYIDFENPGNNIFKVVSQYSVQGSICAAPIYWCSSTAFLLPFGSSSPPSTRIPPFTTLGSRSPFATTVTFPS